jgi:DNA polymerase III subunit delta
LHACTGIATLKDKMDYHELFDEIKAGKTRPIYLLYGSEEYVKDAALKELVERAVPESREMDYSPLDGAGVDDVMRACETLPMFAPKRLVSFEGCEAYFGGRKSADSEKLARYLERIPASACLVLVHRGEQAPQKNPLFNAIGKAGGAAVIFSRLKDEELIRWIIQHARMEGGNMSEGAARSLKERTGNDLNRLIGEIHKLVCYAQGRTIQPGDVEKAASRSLEAGVFPMVDACLRGDIGKAMEMLDTLFRQGESPQAVTGAVAGRLRDILRAKVLLEKGMTRQQVIATLGGSEYATRKAMDESARHSSMQLTRALKRLAEMDFAVKTGRAQQRTGLESAIIEIFRKGDKSREA